ncbi:hypothetical protein ACSFC0_25960 [Serratia marcescens]|uniref:hypothetical protein n=1 Tax=Serratia marcescens TaxID=615 RepID=UPI003EDA27A6
MSDDKTVIIFGILTRLAAALLSYLYIESPLRKCKISLIKSVMILLVAPLSFFTSLYSVSGNFNDFPGRFGQQYQNENRLINQYAKEAGHRSDCLTNGVDSDNKDELCTFGKGHHRRKHFSLTTPTQTTIGYFWTFCQKRRHGHYSTKYTPGTSIASRLSRKYLVNPLPKGIRLPTLVGETPQRLHISYVNNWGNLSAAMFPGWGMPCRPGPFTRSAAM